MKTQHYITGYAIIVTLLILLCLAWRAGYQSGKADTEQRVERVLNHEIKKPHLGGTFDAMCAEFAPEFQ